MTRTWEPSGTQESVEWWARFALRYVVGIGGLAYEVLIDHLHNPTALVIFGGLAGLPDVIGYRAAVKSQLEQEEEARSPRPEHTAR